MNHVRVVGRALFPAFETEIEEESGQMWLRYYPHFIDSIMECTSENDLEEENLGDEMVFLEEMFPFYQRDPFHFHFPFPQFMLGRRHR